MHEVHPKRFALKTNLPLFTFRHSKPNGTRNKVRDAMGWKWMLSSASLRHPKHVQSFHRELWQLRRQVAPSTHPSIVPDGMCFLSTSSHRNSSMIIYDTCYAEFRLCNVSRIITTISNVFSNFSAHSLAGCALQSYLVVQAVFLITLSASTTNQRYDSCSLHWL